VNDYREKAFLMTKNCGRDYKETAAPLRTLVHEVSLIGQGTCNIEQTEHAEDAAANAARRNERGL